MLLDRKRLSCQQQSNPSTMQPTSDFYHASVTVVVIRFTVAVFSWKICLSSQPVISSSALAEYCQWETFNASCPGPDRVIVVDSARYGRMRFGRCMREDHGSVGCAADVRGHVDRKCSGRRRCQLPIPDAVLHAAHPCPKELMPYLEASYSCVTVKTASAQSCALHGGQPVSPDFGFLSSLPSIESAGQFGTSHCPWLIDARHGQRINITLFSFSHGNPSSSGSTGQTMASSESVAAASGSSVVVDDDCIRRDGWTIVVQEYNTTVEFPECGERSLIASGGSGGSSVSSGRRERLVYTSRGESVQIYFRHGYIGDMLSTSLEPVVAPPTHILLRYQVFGCPDMPEVANSVTRRHGDTVVVRCVYGGATFVLSCVESQWKGDFQNCTSRGVPIESVERHEMRASDSFPYGVVVVIAAGVLMGLVFGVILLFGILVLLRRKRLAKRLHSQTADQLFVSTAPSCSCSNHDNIGDDFRRAVTRSSGSVRHFCLPHGELIDGEDAGRSGNGMTSIYVSQASVIPTVAESTVVDEPLSAIHGQSSPVLCRFHRLLRAQQQLTVLPCTLPVTSSQASVELYSSTNQQQPSTTEIYRRKYVNTGAEFQLIDRNSELDDESVAMANYRRYHSQRLLEKPSSSSEVIDTIPSAINGVLLKSDAEDEPTKIRPCMFADEANIRAAPDFRYVRAGSCDLLRQDHGSGALQTESASESP